VALFVCLEKCAESASGYDIFGSTAEDAIEESGAPRSSYSKPRSSSSPRSTYNKLLKSFQSNLSKPENKTEGGVQKQTQASIKARIRFFKKKCQTIASVIGTRGSSGSAAATFQSRVVT
jgi:hypothetical protein